MTIQYIGIHKITKRTVDGATVSYAGSDPDESLTLVLQCLEDSERWPEWVAAAVLSYDPEMQETKVVHDRDDLRRIMNAREDDRLAAE